MDLCCKINPTKECTTCKGTFCPEHVFTPPKLYSGDREKYPSRCFSCLDETRQDNLKKTGGKLTARDLFIQARQLAPTGYITISFQVTEGRPDSGFTTEWRIYHESLKDSKGATPEQALASFKAKVKGINDPQVTDLDKVF